MADINVASPGGDEAALRLALFNLRSFNGTIVRRTTNLTGQNIAAASFAIPFQEVVTDTFGLWSAGAPTRLTIPSGLNGAWMEFKGGVLVSSDTSGTWDYTFIGLHNSGGTLIKASNVDQRNHVGTSWEKRSALGPVQVATGDYVVSFARTQSDTSVTIDGATDRTSLSAVILGMG